MSEQGKRGSHGSLREKVDVVVIAASKESSAKKGTKKTRTGDLILNLGEGRHVPWTGGLPHENCCGEETYKKSYQNGPENALVKKTGAHSSRGKDGQPRRGE